MPKFLHAADIHVDSPLEGLDAHGDAPVEQLRGATRLAFKALVDGAITERVAFVAIAGDLYDTQPLLASALFVRKELQRLADAKIPVVMVLGNHDNAGVAPKSLRLPEGVHVLPADRAGSISPVPGVIVHGRSYPRRDCREDLVMSYPDPTPGALNIGLLHTALGDPAHDDYAPTTPSALAARGYQYWALGHVHRFSHIDRSGVPLVFPGNLQGLHARETGPKGAVIVEYEGDRILSIARRMYDVVRWRHVELDAATVASDLVVDAKRAVLDATALDRDEKRRCAVRVTVRGVFAESVRPISSTELREALLGELQEAGDDIWLEKVRVEASVAPAARTELDEQLSTLARTLAEDEDARRDLARLVDEVRTQLRRTDAALARSDDRAVVRAEALVGDAGGMTPAEAESLLARAVEVIRRELV